jgi:hypothetical protein
MKLDDWSIRERVGLSIRPGVIQVSSAWASIFSENLILVELDCKSKYPVINATSINVVWLSAGPHTLYPGTTNDLTEVRLDLPPGFQVGPVEIGRYDVAIFCYRRDDSKVATLLWESK